MTGFAFCIMALAVVVMALGARPARADIYWSSGSYPNKQIGRVALDGSSANPSFIQSQSLNMTTDGTHLYWTNFSDAIGRANLDGSDVNNSFIPNDGDASSVAVGGGYIFWTSGQGGLYRAPLVDPRASTQIFASGASEVATDGTYLYWSTSSCTNAPCIARGGLDGSNANWSWREVAAAGSMAFDGQYIYWVGTDGHAGSQYGIYRGSLSDPYISGAIVTGYPQIIGMAIDSSHVYWTVGYNGSGIARANLDGSSPNPNFIGNAYGAYGIAIDPDTTHTEPINTHPPGISGTPRQGLTLTESHGSWSNDTPTSYSYQWLRCDAAGAGCTAIVGATGDNYAADVGDAGGTLRVQEVATNPWGSSSPATSRPTSVVQTGVPVSSKPPTISGTAVEGATLTESHGLWASIGSLTGYAYQWLRCSADGTSCTSIPGATQVSYTLTAADVGSAIAVTETAANSYGPSLPAPSASSAPVATAVPFDDAPPTLVGAPVEGQTISAVPGQWSNNPLTFAYSWLRCDAAGGSCQTTTQSATDYLLSPSDIGRTLRVREIAANQWGNGGAATSAPIGPIVDVPVSVQAFALVGTTRAVLPGPVASFSADRAVPLGNYSSTVAWGDGSRSAGTIARGPHGTFLVDAFHVYRRAGTYSLIVRVASKTGASGQSTNRVTVITADVCPKQTAGHRRNCLGEITIPGGCVIAGDALRVGLPATTQIAGVTYRIDHIRRAIAGRGRRFAAALSTTGLSHGKHQLTASINFRSGHPRTLSKKRSFAVC